MTTKLKEYSQDELPIFGLTKVGDLINYEGPILSLFRDNIKHYLFYWVDHDELYNRWLIWRVENENLYNYLNNEISLRDLILSPEKDYVFSVDIDNDLNYQNIFALEPGKIPTDYLPEIKSYYKLALPLFAKEFIAEYEESDHYYKILMKQRSIIFNISPTNLNFARAVTTNDAGHFLSKLTHSINGYIEENFYSKFKDSIQGIVDFKKHLNQAKAILAPRLFGLKFSSFEVLVGVDTVKKIAIPEFSDWQNTILENYEREVVDVDYSDIIQLQNIAEKYSESARDKIYSPYIDIINNTHFSFVIKDKSDKIKKFYYKINKEREEILIPNKKPIATNLPKGKKFISMVIEVEEGQEVSEINKKLLKTGLLFSQQVDELNFELNSVSNDEIKIEFKSPIQYVFSFTNNHYASYLEDLGIYLESDDRNVLLDNLQNEVIKVYYQSQLDEDQNLIKTFFETMVDKVTVKK